MSNIFRTLLLTCLFLQGFAGLASESELTKDSLKYLNYSNRSLLSQARKAADNDVYDEAKTIYLILVSRDSTNPLYNYECGLNFFLNLFEQPQSLPYFEKALKYSTKDTIEKVFYYLGQAYQLNNRYDEAIFAYNNFKRFVKGNNKELADLNEKIEQCQQGKGFLATFNNVINIDNLGSNINTSEAEYVPVVKGDESVMYFTARRKTNVGGEKEDESNRYYEDMFISKGDSGLFHVGERFTLGDTLTNKIKNTGGHESVVSLSYDEKYLITYKNNSLWVSSWVNNGWSRPEKFPKSINFGEYQNHGSLSMGNDTLYFSSNGRGGFGGMDIYMSIKDKDGNWGKAINLGPRINTPYDEDSPSISADNITLYFSSKGHNSMGGFDVYKSVFEYNQWMEPLNMGMPVNSSGDDIYFKYDKNKKQAYFSSSRQRGFGDYDIYRLIDYGTPRFDDCQTMMNTINTFSITLDAKKNVDVKGPTKTYHWEFSDGEHAEGEVVTHDFKEPGKHSYKLYVLDPIVNTLIEEVDSTVFIANYDKVHFTSADTISMDSLMSFTGVPEKIENATILKYHWSFGDSTLGADSSIASHKFAGPGTYEVKLSMVARDDSTERVFQKCITKTINVLNKEEYMHYYMKTVARENKRKGFNSDMLGLTHLDFLAPDTTALEMENIFDADPVYIPYAKVLAYNWDFGDTLIKIAPKKISHSFDSIAIYKVKMNVVFQMDSTKGIYERDVEKDIVVVNKNDYENIHLNRQVKKFSSSDVDKLEISIVANDTTTIAIPNNFSCKMENDAYAKILRYQWSFGDSSKQTTSASPEHSYAKLGQYTIKLAIIYQDTISNGIYETSAFKLISVIPSLAYDSFKVAQEERIAKANEAMKSDSTKLVAGNSPENPGKNELNQLQVNQTQSGLETSQDSTKLVAIPKDSIALAKQALVEKSNSIHTKANETLINDTSRIAQTIASDSTNQQAKTTKSFEVAKVDPKKLVFNAPDTTAVNLSNLFNGQPVKIPNSEILSYEWNLGDSSKALSGQQIVHTYKTPGLYPVKLGLTYQDKETKGIYATELSKTIAVLDSVKFQEFSEARKSKEKLQQNLASQTANAQPVYDTTNLPKIKLENIYFDYDKFAIRPDARATLLRNIELLKIDSTITIKVSANTDSRGSKAYNFKLSAKRAISAINFLAEHKIPRDRIIAVVSLGETNLVNNCKDNVKCNEKQHQLNRRDEFHVVGRLKK